MIASKRTQRHVTRPKPIYTCMFVVQIKKKEVKKKKKKREKEKVAEEVLQTRSQEADETA